MQVIARIKNLRIAPKKVRLVAHLVRGMRVDLALNHLEFLNKKSATPLGDVIKSAVANAVHNYKMDPKSLVIKDISVNKGLTIKRFLPRAQGRATPILGIMSHVIVTLEGPGGEKVEAVSKVKTGKAKSAPHDNEIHKNAADLNQTVPDQLTDEKGNAIVDPRMEGKHRHNQNVDRRNMKGAGGHKRKLFNRKAG